MVACFSAGCGAGPSTEEPSGEAVRSQGSAASTCPTSSITQRQQQASAVLRFIQGGAWETILNTCTLATPTATVAQVKAEATYWQGRVALGRSGAPAANRIQYVGNAGPNTTQCGVSATPSEIFVWSTATTSPFSTGQASAKGLLNAMRGCYGGGIEGFAFDATSWLEDNGWRTYRVAFMPTVGGSKWPAFTSYVPYQAHATHMLRYLLGGAAVGGWDTTCPTLKAKADALRTSILADEVPNALPGNLIRNHYPLASTTISGLPASPHRFEAWDAAVNFQTPFYDLVLRMEACFGSGVLPFALIGAAGDLYDQTANEHYTSFDTDPEAAVLDASLGTTSGASASAHGQNSGEGVMVYRFASSTLAASGRTAWLGQNCVNGTATYGVGSVAGGIVAYANSPTNTYLKCSQL